MRQRLETLIGASVQYKPSLRHHVHPQASKASQQASSTHDRQVLAVGVIMNATSSTSSKFALRLPVIGRLESKLHPTPTLPAPSLEANDLYRLMRSIDERKGKARDVNSSDTYPIITLKQDRKGCRPGNPNQRSRFGMDPPIDEQSLAKRIAISASHGDVQ